MSYSLGFLFSLKVYFSFSFLYPYFHLFKIRVVVTLNISINHTGTLLEGPFAQIWLLFQICLYHPGYTVEHNASQPNGAEQDTMYLQNRTGATKVTVNVDGQMAVSKTSEWLLRARQCSLPLLRDTPGSYVHVVMQDGQDSTTIWYQSFCCCLGHSDSMWAVLLPPGVYNTRAEISETLELFAGARCRTSPISCSTCCQFSHHPSVPTLCLPDIWHRVENSECTRALTTSAALGLLSFKHWCKSHWFRLWPVLQSSLVVMLSAGSLGPGPGYLWELRRRRKNYCFQVTEKKNQLETH